MTILKPQSNNTKRIVALVLLLVVLICGYQIGKGLFQNLTPLPPAHTIRELLEQRGHWERNKPLMAAIGIAPDTPIAPDLVPGGGSSSSSHYITALEDATFLTFQNSGILTKYGKLPGLVNEADSPIQPSVDLPVSKESLISLANSLIATGALDEKQYDGLSFTVDEEFISYQSDDRSDTPDVLPENPQDGTWGILIRRFYHGIRCMSMVTLTVNVTTGRVEMLANLPFYLPDSMEENISESEALQIAKTYAAKRNVPTDNYESLKEFSYIGDAIKSSWGFSPKSLLCWVITFQIPEGNDTHPYHVLVDCRTGKIAGVVT